MENLFKDSWYRYTCKFFYLYFKSLHRLNLFYQEPLYNKGALIALNHCSYYDALIFGAAYQKNDIYFLANDPLFRTFFIGFMLKRLHALPLGGTAKDAATFKMVEKILKNDQKVVIFPEGRRSNTGLLLPLKPGLAQLALKTGFPIIPAYIDGSFASWPLHKKLPRFGHKITCVFGKRFSVEDYLKMEKKLAIQYLTQRISNELQLLHQWVQEVKP